MARIISTLDDAITYINTLFEADSTPPTSGEEDYTVWTSLINTAVNIWESEEGVTWRELFVKLADAPDGDKTTSAGDHSYAVPSLFNFPSSAYVWLGSGNQKVAYQIIPQEKVQLMENNSDRWCYFLMDTSPTLEFNPNLTINGGDTISYNYYKFASKLTTGSSTFEMSDPFFAIYYTLSELKKDEGDTSALPIATQKLEGMKTRNISPSWYQEDSLNDGIGDGFGT
jgi:hypothetical protein